MTDSLMVKGAACLVERSLEKIFFFQEQFREKGINKLHLYFITPRCHVRIRCENYHLLLLHHASFIY